MYISNDLRNKLFFSRTRTRTRTSRIFASYMKVKYYNYLCVLPAVQFVNYAN